MVWCWGLVKREGERKEGRKKKKRKKKKKKKRKRNNCTIVTMGIGRKR